MSETTLIRCPSCASTNRVPRVKIEKGLLPRCGACREPLPIFSKSLTVTDATFAVEVERSPLPVLLDLWAAWCGPCKMVAPMLDELATELAGRVRVVKMNVDENPATAGRFNVASIPTLFGVERRTGDRSYRGRAAKSGDRSATGTRPGLNHRFIITARGRT